MEDTRTDEEKELSPYFDRWKYTGNWFQQRFQIGPRKAIYKHYTDAELRAMAEAGDEIYFEPTVPVLITDQDGAAKTVTLHEWMLRWAEGLDDSIWNLAKKGWAYKCIEIKRNAIAAIPWGIFRGDEEVQKHPYVDLMREVNPDNNWHDLIGYLMADLDVYGQGFWLKIMRGKKVHYLRRLNPRTMSIKANRKGIQKFIQQTASVPIEFPREMIVYFHLYDPENDVEGISPLMACQTACEIEIEADNHLKDFFENKAMPDYIMSLQTTNTHELQRVAKQWEKDFGGKGKQHKVGWVGGGGTPHEVGYAPKDLALKELREEARRKICGAFGVPPAVVGAWEAANYATIREQRQSLYTEEIDPKALYIEGVINAELSPHFGDIQFHFKFNDLPVLQEDINNKAKRLVWFTEAGIIKPEIAAVEAGFEKGDVPPEAPAPQPSDNNNLASMGSRAGDTLRDQRKSLDENAELALYKWRRKCMRLMKKDEAPLCDFNSIYLDDEITDNIKEQLELANTKDDVYKIFEEVLEYAKELPIKQEIFMPQFHRAETPKMEFRPTINVDTNSELLAKEVAKELEKKFLPELNELSQKVKNYMEENEIEMGAIKDYMEKRDEEGSKRDAVMEELIKLIAADKKKDAKQASQIIHVEPTPVNIENKIDLDLPLRVKGIKEVERDRTGLITKIQEEQVIE